MPLCHKGKLGLVPRVHIEFAAKAPTAAILRRGPSDWVQLLLWDTVADTVCPGSWFHGRIPDQSCSLSPNGELFAYKATKYQGKKTRGVNYCWTAISKLPWLTALALWPQADTWSGAAAFADDRTLIIDCAHWERLKTKDRLPTGFRVLPRWIGQDAPEQTLPQPTVADAQFNGDVGADQSGREFTYKEGKLIRDNRVLVDLTIMHPDPNPPPAIASSW